MTPPYGPEALAWMRLAWSTRLPPRIQYVAATRWLATGRPLSELFETDSRELAITLDLLPRRIDQIVLSRPPTDDLIAPLAEAGVELLTLDDERYPGALLSTEGLSSPVLSCLGEIGALRRQAVAVVGRREASDDAVDYAHRLAAALAGHGLNVVSGNAIGVDRAAHAGAAEAGGPTTAVLPHGLLTFHGNDDVDLALSVSHPRAPWRVRRALEQNGIVTGLSAAVVVVEAETSGGTWHAAMQAIGQRRPLYVRPDRADSGGVALTSHSAVILPGDPIEAAAVLAEAVGG